GHGAPMVPVFHRAMLRLIKRAHPVGVLNLGGVANVTFINGGTELVACDTGPGNALIDDFVRLRTGQPQDDEGRAAAAGKVDEAAAARAPAAYTSFPSPPRPPTPPSAPPPARGGGGGAPSQARARKPAPRPSPPPRPRRSPRRPPCSRPRLWHGSSPAAAR